MVFSTLHTNDASGPSRGWSTWGSNRTLSASTVEGSWPQRLVRRLCPHCKERYVPKDDDLPDDFPRPLPEHLFKPVGCHECRDTGYAGRMGIYELLRTDVGVRHLCVERASSAQIRDYSIKQGMLTMRQDGWDKVIAGQTSVDDVVRITKGG